MLLKRIASSLKPELQKLIPLLDQQNIKTTESLIFTTPSTLYHTVPQCNEIYIDQLIEECIRLSAPPEYSGEEIFLGEQNLTRKGGSRWEGFGVDGLDRGLEGWEGVGVVEVCGVQRVGKSLLALHAVLRRLVLDPNAVVRWLDCDGSFSPTRAIAILEGWGRTDSKSILDRLLVIGCFRIEPDLYNVIAAIRGEYANSAESSTKGKTKMLVIDPIFNLFKDMLSNSSSQGHASLVSVLEELSEITYSYGLTTIVINGISSHVGKTKNDSSIFSTTTVKPALGTAFTYFGDINLLIQESGRVFGMADEEERERVRGKPGLRGVVEVLKSRVSPSGTWAVFETNGTSLLDVVPPPIDDERTIRMSAGLPTGPTRPLHGPLAATMVP